MKGFFTKKDTAQIKKTQNRGRAHKTPKDPCDICGLYKTCQSPRMSYTGKGKMKILILAEAPGREEDEDWEKLGYEEPTQLIGKAGRLLRKKAKGLGVDIDRDCWKLNVLNCRPPGNKKPTKKQLKCCWPNIDKVIQKLKPEFIWLLGGAAVESFYMERFSNLSITRWRGLCIPDRDTKAWVVPMFHPSYLLRNEKDKNLESTFDRDLKWAVEQLKRTPPIFEDFDSQTTLLYEGDEVVRFLQRIIKEKPLIAFDYETSALKPYLDTVWVDRHKIWCISVNGTAFPYDYPYWSKGARRQIKKLWQRIMASPKIKKVAHGLKFEDMWTREIIEATIAGWKACTMNSAHIIDDRSNFTGLKFQAYINYGMYEYDTEFKKYLKPKPESPFNRLNEMPLENLLQYCALDSLLGERLYYDQQKLFDQMEDERPKANKFFTEGLVAFANTQHRGICADKKYYLEQEKILTGQIQKVETKILSGKEAKLFEKKTGNPLTIAKDISAADLRILLFDIMKLTPSAYTAKAKMASVDHDTLSKINTPFTKRITERRKLTKTVSYIDQYVREIVNGKLHPFFDLHLARSFRSCIAKGSKVYAVRDFLKYPDGVPIEKIKKGDYVYCFDNDLNPAIKKVLWAGKTGRKKVIRIHWKGGRGKRGHLDLTPEHRVRHISGKYIEAQDLVGDLRTKEENKRSPKIRVLSLNRTGDRLYFTGHITKNATGILESHLVYSKLIGNIEKNDIIHHRNKEHLDHLPANLEKTSISKHAKHHCRFNDPEIRKKNLEAIKNSWKNNDRVILRGEDNPNSLNLSKFTCLRLLVSLKGKISKVPYDFNSFKKYLAKYKIDPKIVRLRYDKNGDYIPKNRLNRLNKKGILAAQKELGHSYYRLKSLYRSYNIEFKRKWGNQYGEFVPGNHSITKIEWLNKVVDVYDIEVKDCHNFFANQICVHNSSSMPNFQNVPVRDEYAKKVCRSGIKPSPGNKLGFFDYSGIEVCIAACFTKDPTLIAYIQDPSTDMHRDQAEAIFLLNHEQVTTDIRFYAKNCFVFPEFYGSWYKACADNLSENCFELDTEEGISVVEHLSDRGIKTYDDFENHVKSVEKKFWDKFHVYREWKDKVITDYQKKGYVDMFFGHRRGGYLSNNMILNTPIQGTAFHCLLWSYIEIDKELTKKKTKLVGQIHDELIPDIYPPEEKEIVYTIKDVMCNRIRKEHDWLIVPLTVDEEYTEIDGNWYDVK